jgi:hypothetical protein
MDFSKENIIMILTGMPSTGKTFLACSAPDVLVIDADNGMKRIYPPEYRKTATYCKTYEELLGDLKQAEGKFQTIAIDTCGALIDMLKDWAIRNDPKASKSSGGFSLQGFGIIKSEFLRLSAELRNKFNVIYLFHESKEKNGDEVFWDIVCEGSARNLVWQPADIGAHLHIVNGERMLGFTPTMNYNAKSSYGIKGLIKVPEIKAGEVNDFLTKLFAQIKTNIVSETASLKPQQEAYEKAMQEGKAILDALQAPENALTALDSIRKLQHGLTSQKELEAAFKAKTKDNGWTYDPKAKSYVAKAE